MGQSEPVQAAVDLIALDLTSVVHATIVLIGILVVTLFVAGSTALDLSTGSQHLPNWFNRYLRHLSIPLLIAVFFGFLSGTLIPVNSAMLVAMLFAALVALVTTRAERDRRSTTRSQEQLIAIARHLRREHLTVALFLLALGIVTYAAGLVAAENQDTFKVNAADRNEVLLAIYSHNIGVFGYVDKTDKLTGQLAILKLGDNPKLVLIPRTFPHGIGSREDK